jgi:hypothetical protein
MAGKALWLGQGVGGQIAMTAGNGTVLVSMLAWSNHGRGCVLSEDRCARATARA